MSASLLRIGHLRCVNKCLQTEGWKMLSRAPTALPFSTKSSGSKNSSKKTSKDKSKPKTYFDIEKLVQHKPCNFPKKEVSPAASAVTEAALEAIASAATKHTPPVASAGTIAAAADGTTQAVTASFVKEVPSNTATDESTVEVVPEAFPGEDALMLEASKVAAEPAVDVPQVPMHPASVESAPGPLVDVALVDGALNLVHEAVPNKAEMEPVAEITDATDVVPGSEDLVDPAWVLSKAAEEELQMDSPAEAVGPSQAHMDPVQRLFLDSIREYSANSQAAGGLVDADPLYQKVLEEETAKLQRLYGGGDLTSFPNFKFTEPQWDEGSQK
ncbi:PREDICTED: uncharacterized protein LOC106904182 isoform X5 [Poecilia mexicana]|uniref:uncharacterized protein LOC106904182 isoform X5 n=1 Tax=Poecilia mexicana TaxID=48701 RepID=UPI00072DE503|nr:PREDICTED: uncharacterized protein LOC106904182 isoform X5 [Poecilia mexicana]